MPMNISIVSMTMKPLLLVVMVFVIVTLTTLSTATALSSDDGGAPAQHQRTPQALLEEQQKQEAPLGNTATMTGSFRGGQTRVLASPPPFLFDYALVIRSADTKKSVEVFRSGENKPVVDYVDYKLKSHAPLFDVKFMDLSFTKNQDNSSRLSLKVPAGSSTTGINGISTFLPAFDFHQFAKNKLIQHLGNGAENKMTCTSKAKCPNLPNKFVFSMFFDQLDFEFDDQRVTVPKIAFARGQKTFTDNWWVAGTDCVRTNKRVKQDEVLTCPTTTEGTSIKFTYSNSGNMHINVALVVE